METMTWAVRPWSEQVQERLGEWVLRGYPEWLFRCFAAAYAVAALATIAALWPR